MSKTAELIAELQANAEFDSQGAFSLDRDKARQKMRQFQLADPRRYVLLLVEAALLRGATTIAFEIDADDMRMRFDAALEWEDLDELYTSLFVDRSSVAIQARRELALACNAAMALNPRWARIESWSRTSAGIAGVRAILRPDQSDTIERVEQAPNHVLAPSTEIHVKDRFRPGLVVRFVHDIGGSLPEELLIRERCALASVPITLDGKRVSHGLPRDAIAAVDFQNPGLRGVAGIRPDETQRSAMVLLSNGVEISTTVLNDSVPGLWFWVDCSNLRKDVSQADIVRSDPSYEALLAEIARARDRVLGRLVELWNANEFDETTSMTAAEVFELLRSCFVRWADANWLDSEAGTLSGALGQFADLPLWRTVDQRWATPRELAGRAAYTTRSFDGVQPVDFGPVIHAIDGAEEVEAIKRIYADEARDVTEQLEREVVWELERRKWRTRPHTPELPRGAGQCAIRFAADGYAGELALRPSAGCGVRIVVDGCLLCEVEFELGALRLSAVLCGPMKPTQDYTRARPDRVFAAGLLLLLSRVPSLLSAWAEAGGAEHVLRENLLDLTVPNFECRWLEAFGFKPEVAQTMVKILGAPPLLPTFGLGSGKPCAVAQLLRFPTIDGRTVSLVEIDEERHRRVRKRDMVLIVDRSVPASVGLDELILCVNFFEGRLLAAIFGGALIHDDSLAYRNEIGRRSFLGRSKLEPSLVRGATWMTRVDYTPASGTAPIRGLVGIAAVALRDRQADEPRKLTIDVIVEGRKLATVEEKAWLPGVSASLAWDQAPVNPDWDGLAGPTDPLQQAVNVGLIEIIRARATEAIDRNERPDDDVRRLLWMAITAPFISVEHAQAWRRFRAELHKVGEFSAAVEAYCVRLSLAGHGFQRAILESFELLEQVPLIGLASSSGAISLAELTRVYAATGEISHVEDRSLRFETQERVIVRGDPIDQLALIGLFGREAFCEVSAWIHERRHQLQFESRAPLETLRVPEINRLIGVEFERDGLRGELAIPPWMPDESVLVKLVYCHNRRTVDTVVIHLALPVLGIIDDPEAELSDDYSRVEMDSPRMAKIRKLLNEVLTTQLLPALAEAYPRLDAHQQTRARGWIGAYWRNSSPRAGQHLDRLSPAGRKLAALELFRDTDGTPRSLLELGVRNREQQRIWYVDTVIDNSIAPPFPILLRRPDEHQLLNALFNKVEDFSQRWSARIDGEQRRQQAQAMPDLGPPKGALVEVAVKRHGLEGALWLPDRQPFDSGVIIGDRGKVLAVKDFDESLVAQGAIIGEVADDRFEEPALSHAQSRYLDGRVTSLYAALLAQHQADLQRPDRPDFLEPELVRLRAVRLELLRAGAIKLARAQCQGRSFDAILGNLVRRLEHEPLLRLATGRLISIGIARKARPQEHAHLEIWDPHSPALDPSERARLLLGEAEPERTTVEARDLQLEDERVEHDQAITQMQPMIETSEPASVAAPKPARDPVGEVLERVREELRLLREHHQIVLSEGHLDGISVEVRCDGDLVRIDKRGVVFDSEHPRFLRATKDADPIWVSFLASVAYTGLNRWLDEVSEDDELLFHRRHAEHLLSGLLEG